MVQVEMNLLRGTRGGWRPGAGRPRDRARRDPAHRARGEHRARFPLHVTLRCVADVPRLRTPTMSSAIRDAMARVHGFAGFRIDHVSIQHNHLHLLVEADDGSARSRGLASFAIAVARAINRAARRRGRVFAFRYHAVALTTPKQVRHTLGYVLGNWRHHREDVRTRASRAALFDPYSSASMFDGWMRAFDGRDYFAFPVDRPRAWLLSTGWRCHGPIDPRATPG